MTMERRHRLRIGSGRPASAATLAVTGLLIVGSMVPAACRPERSNDALPPAAVLDTVYGGRVDVSLNGNVVEVRVTQDASQLRRGGSVWAKAGPYIYLFTPQTRDLFVNFGGVGGVRVTTTDASGDLIARAMLERNTLTSITWKKAINTASKARVDATTKPQTMVDLAEYGEEHTSYEYGRKYVGSN